MFFKITAYNLEKAILPIVSAIVIYIVLMMPSGFSVGGKITERKQQEREESGKIIKRVNIYGASTIF